MSDSSHFSAVYKRVDGEEINALVYVPNSAINTSKPCPVVINVHGGAFIVGSARMVNQDQIQYCLERGWITVVPNHRLCPGIDLLEGPITDCRDLLSWIYNKGLEEAIVENSLPNTDIRIDYDYVFASGTSSGGHLSLCLGFDVPRPPAAIFDIYGPCYFNHPFWKSGIAPLASKIPKDLTPEFKNQVYQQRPIPIEAGFSLEGQAKAQGPDFSDPRQAFCMSSIADGQLLDAVFPSGDWKKVDPLLNISQSFPPTFIVHGDADTMVPLELSLELYSTLKESGVECGMRVIPGEQHTFAATMKKGSETWNLHLEGFTFLESIIQRK
ncbi:hypothetical protein FAUST_11740 [Fusarium austroamericanum]|uniref:Peptidase S9 prolyl oligopeptidase catalytic domain-containing protein n=1 Tax=Fusarium austroamericanum TaxID=282268 RepID=A0AAN5Z0X8_FUSAU|nr:hypothetical protein FAUST_11740 [Fusarium austroamericanum]